MDGGVSTSDLAWFSDWRTATGASQQALYDGSKWTGQLCNHDVVEIISASGLDFPTNNVLRADYQTDMECLMVQAQDQWPAPGVGEYLFVRLYYRNAIPDGVAVGLPHPVHIGHSPAASYATWVNLEPTSGGVSRMILQLGGGPAYPDQFWGWPFNTNQTYRLELRLHRVTADTAKVDVRVYDGSGALLADDDDWNNGEVSANRRTLAQSDPTFPVTDASFRLIEIGNNGPAGLAAGAGRFIYIGGVAVAVSANPDAWPGPYPAPAEAF